MLEPVSFEDNSFCSFSDVSQVFFLLLHPQLGHPQGSETADVCLHSRLGVSDFKGGVDLPPASFCLTAFFLHFDLLQHQSGVWGVSYQTQRSRRETLSASLHYFHAFADLVVLAGS